MHVCVFVYIFVCICASKLSSLNNNCVCVCSSYFDKEEQLREAASGGRMDEVVSLLDQGIEIQCKNGVRVRWYGHQAVSFRSLYDITPHHCCTNTYKQS